MGNWLKWQNYILIASFAFKIMVLGTMLSLATHNICLDKMLEGEFKWSQLVFKKRKRDDGSAHDIPQSKAVIILTSGGDVSSRRLFVLPQIILSTRLLYTYVPEFTRFFSRITRFSHDRLFIRHCVLLR